ncbi:uncharacterized protein LOC126738295 isoform X3 [Anthonomus grandis grandis]|uniref:uncharacterized protein LOC126738295 isoform X3 n=1 Tax=Anthonomus grandis grandis TaxID=2921223 RepID=UPI002166027C|nr:uncharacterized protein LOC126738295 isoform X3 [Anthonomus grandis grandis]
MPGTEDGEFYPANPLERNYKIPKKATAEISGGNQAAVPVVDVKHFKSFQMAPSVNTPLAASYYNYPYDPNSASAYYNYYNNYTTGTQQGMNVDPPLPPNGITTVEGLKRNIFETYNSIKEKPKTYGLGGKTMQNNESQTAVGEGRNINKIEEHGNKEEKGNNFNIMQDFNNRKNTSQSPESLNNGSFEGIFQNQDHNHQTRFNNRKKQEKHLNNYGFSNNQEYFQNKNNQQDPKINRNFNMNNRWKTGNIQQWTNTERNLFQANHIYNESFLQNYQGQQSFFNGRGRCYVYSRRFNNKFPNEARFGKRQFNGDKWGYDQYETCLEKGYGQYSEQGGAEKAFESNGKYKGFGFTSQKKKRKEPSVELPVEQTVPDLLDDTLPKDLKILFQPLFCKLCELQLSSNQTAKMHYKSKNHEKKIRKWLTEYAEKTGEPLHHRATTRGQDKKKTNKEDAEKNPSWFHCDICDLDLTGRMHAESHYMGRNHQKALLGHKNPAGNGYYDADGKWIRIKSHKSKSYDFEKGEDNFGLAFKPDGDPAARISDEPPSKKKKKDPVNPKEFHCEVCNINTTCQEQLNTHFMGQKHVKKLKQLGLENHTTKRKSIEESVLVADFPTIPSVVALELNINVAAHRTPSGDYYCPTCNLSLNSEVQFLQHMKSKGHGKKLAQKKKDDAPPAAIITSPIVTIENDTSSLVNISEPVTK